MHSDMGSVVWIGHWNQSVLVNHFGSLLGQSVAGYVE